MSSARASIPTSLLTTSRFSQTSQDIPVPDPALLTDRGPTLWEYQKLERAADVNMDREGGGGGGVPLGRKDAC